MDYSAGLPAGSALGPERVEERMEDAPESSNSRRPLDPRIAWGKQVAGEVYDHLCEEPQSIRYGLVTNYLGPIFQPGMTGCTRT